tara:strand:- start:527 stop:649 length:123 start_codon:yes stop_codon:yes gene_type:complete
MKSMIYKVPKALFAHRASIGYEENVGKIIAKFKYAGWIGI